MQSLAIALPYPIGGAPLLEYVRSQFGMNRIAPYPPALPFSSE